MNRVEDIIRLLTIRVKLNEIIFSTTSKLSATVLIRCGSLRTKTIKDLNAATFITARLFDCASVDVG